MNEEIKKERSRNYPKMSLAGALDLAKKLYAKAGKSKISPIVAVGALGYNGLNGAALGTLGTLTQYGLIDRERGKTVSVSPLAIKLIHPLNSAQQATSTREAILAPEVFKELYDGGFHKCDESLISNHLIQSGFTTDGAKKAASVFIENVAIANLAEDSIILADESEQEDKADVDSANKDSKPPVVTVPPVLPDLIKGKKVLATYSIPLVDSEAKLEFTGENLAPEDFDVLIEYIGLFKKRFERKQKMEASQMPSPPFVIRAKNGQMVKIIGITEKDGERLYEAEGGDFILPSELFSDSKF